VASVVVVTVYEGRVEVARGDTVRAVAAGERAVMGDGVALEADRRAIAAKEPPPGAEAAKQRGAAAGRDNGAADEAGAAGAADSEVRLARLERENDALKKEMVGLKVRAAEADALRDAHGTYGLSQAELERMAERCELRWDSIPFRLGEPPRLAEEDIESFALSAAQTSRINELMAAENQMLVDAIRAAYVEVIGDDLEAIQAVAPGALLNEVEDKTPIGERRAIFKKLAEERARGAPPLLTPEALAGVSPIERVLRVLTSSGDRLEAALAEELGQDTARQLRDTHGGFGNVNHGSYGCPGEPHPGIAEP
jgi:hypothetical protein